MTTARFDDVIIGGGSAGCVVANRLSANGRRRVLLVEAGQDTPPDNTPEEILDSYPMPLFFGDRYVWPGLSAAAGRLGNNPAIVKPYEQGRVMGGGSSINVQAANRGLPRDYDRWRDLGAKGWGWDDVLPYFRKLETDLDYGGLAHGAEGPIPIRRIRREDWPAFGRAVGEAFAATGLPHRLDQNADFEDGIYPPAFSNRNDRRVSSAAAYLDNSVRQRGNLTIWTDSQVNRLVMNGACATQVEITRSNQQVVVEAGRVIITAGALQSPAILLRAGIGSPTALRDLGIDVQVALPGVGENLRDHPALTFCQFLPPHLRLPMSVRRASFVALRYSSQVAGAEASDMYVTASARGGWHGLGKRLGLYFLWCNQPHSAGRVALRSADPTIYPDVDLNLLADKRDLDRMMDAVRLLARLVVVPTLNAASEDFFPASFSPRIKRLSRFNRSNKMLAAILGMMLDVPAAIRHAMVKAILLNGKAFADILSDDAALEDFVRRSVFGVWHPSGTCRMGDPSDPMAVVDSAGQVIATENLYVADASVMPRLPTANTNIPTIMIAEKISETLLRGAEDRFA
ncbi:MAG: glucose-methanol-choline oxidoreductase [Afipia sp. 62-7]|nr:GMC family oxidoreductase N-terminal domain-containing protein [Alphaproteobacteria bacterium]OJU14647.1 MAG: glucose-methanol-choline oxidoreductase [Afipia sp. 62-7]